MSQYAKIPLIKIRFISILIALYFVVYQPYQMVLPFVISHFILAYVGKSRARGKFQLKYFPYYLAAFLCLSYAASFYTYYHKIEYVAAGYFLFHFIVGEAKISRVKPDIFLLLEFAPIIILFFGVGVSSSMLINKVIILSFVGVIWTLYIALAVFKSYKPSMIKYLIHSVSGLLFWAIYNRYYLPVDKIWSLILMYHVMIHYLFYWCKMRTEKQAKRVYLKDVFTVNAVLFLLYYAYISTDIAANHLWILFDYQYYWCYAILHFIFSANINFDKQFLKFA